MHMFFTLIFAVLLLGTNLYTRSEYLTIPIRFKVQLPTSAGTETTAGSPKHILKYIRGSCTPRRPQRTKIILKTST